MGAGVMRMLFDEVSSLFAQTEQLTGIFVFMSGFDGSSIGDIIGTTDYYFLRKPFVPRDVRELRLLQHPLERGVRQPVRLRERRDRALAAARLVRFSGCKRAAAPITERRRHCTEGRRVDLLKLAVLRVGMKS